MAAEMENGGWMEDGLYFRFKDDLFFIWLQTREELIRFVEFNNFFSSSKYIDIGLNKSAKVIKFLN